MVGHDLVIRNATVIDGRGTAPFQADIGVDGGIITAVGEVQGRGKAEIDAGGRLVTPGFIDIHTHYDAQITWSERLMPSPLHGVTTVVTGNCGVGFAPCRPQDRTRLVELMEGVEDIPEVVMAEGLPWNWETFPQFLDMLGRRAFDIDVAVQLPHSPLRIYVMGERGARREEATAEDRDRMAALTREAIRAGAIGFGTSRILFHRSSRGETIPTLSAGEEELEAIALAMAAEGKGVLQFVIDFAEHLDAELPLLRRLVEKSGRPLSLSLGQVHSQPEAWKKVLAFLDEANQDGLPLRAQVIGRPTGILVGFELSVNPFSFCPSYAPIAHLPLAEKLVRLRNPELRARLISEEPATPDSPLQALALNFEWLFPLGDPPNYEPPLDTSVAAQAKRRGVSPAEVAYDLLLERDGQAMLFRPFANYASGSLDAVLAMMSNPNTVLGLGDGGAHYGIVCDSSWPTYMLTHWTRDRMGQKLSLTDVVQELTSRPAQTVGLCDRGVVAPGYKADLNVIDYERLRLHGPEVLYDLPAHARRLSQRADGFVATIVSGQIVYREGVATGLLPGRLVRGAMSMPTAA